MSSRKPPSSRPIHPCLLSIFDGNFGAEYTVWAYITTNRTSQLPNLVVAQANTLRIYSINGESGKLELIQSFPNLSGSVCYLENLPAEGDNEADSLLIGFAGHPRLAVCSLQPAPPLTANSKILLTSSLIDLTQACMDASLGSVTPLEQDLIATLYKRRDEATLAVVLGGGVAVAAISLQRHESIWRASTADDPYLLNLMNLAPLDKQASASSSTNTNANAYTQKIAHRFGDILSCCFLNGYTEPTLVLLHAPNRSWSGRLTGGSQQSCYLTAISVTVTHQRAAVLWSVPVSVDALSIQPTGEDGCLVVSANSILQVTNGGHVSSVLAVNGWAGVTYPSDIKPNPWPLPRLAIALDGAKVYMIKEDLGFVVLRYGEIYLLQRVDTSWSLLPSGESIGSMGHISSLLVLPEIDGKLKLLDERKSESNIMTGLLFAGSRLGDSSLLGYALEGDITLRDALKLSGSVNRSKDGILNSTMQGTEDSSNTDSDDYELILEREEAALYATDEVNTISSKSDFPVPDIVPPSDEEEENSKSVSLTEKKGGTKRAKLVRLTVLRFVTALDSITAVGPLGPCCEGPLGTNNKKTGSEVNAGTAKIFPCGYGSSGGLALVTAPGHDTRSILVEEDCLNVQSVFCLDGLVVMGMQPDNYKKAGVNILNLTAGNDGKGFQLSQVDMETFVRDEQDSRMDIINDGQLLAACEFKDNKNICLIVRTMTTEYSHTLVTLRRMENSLQTISHQLLSAAHSSDIIQISPFVNNKSSTNFGCVWSIGCAIVYNIQPNGEIEEFTIEGTASTMEVEDDDEELFYQYDRITAIDLFLAPKNIFKQPDISRQRGTNEGAKTSHRELDEEDRLLYGRVEETPKPAESSPIYPSEQESTENCTYVAICRQNGELQIFEIEDMTNPIWQAKGCGQGIATLDHARENEIRFPRMHKVYAQEIRFFTAGSYNGIQDTFFSVLNNFGDIHVYEVKAGRLNRIPLRLPTRPSKKQSEHHMKLRRKKNLPSNAVDESILKPKEFYHNRFTRFSGISGQNGLFTATTRPLWLVSERRSLVALSHRSRHVAPAGGRARPVCSFSSGVVKSLAESSSIFITLHERIGRVGSQRLTVFGGISSLFSPLGILPGGGYCVEKIPIGVTVHRVQFIDDKDVSSSNNPLYVVLISREMEVDQSSLNDDGLTPEERQRIKDEKEEAKIKRQVEADLGGFDIEQEWVEEIERENIFEINTSLGGAPPIHRSAYSLWIVDASNNWDPVDSYELGEFEHGLTMDVMHLTEINIEPGSNSSIGESVGGDSLFVTIGTGIVDADGEDVSAKGRVLLFEVKREDAKSQAAGAQVAELSLVYEKDILHGPVTSLSCLKSEGRSRLVIGAGADVNVEQWGMKKLTQVGFFRATMQILDIMHFKNFFILSDAYDSLYFLVWRESDKSVTLLAKDYEPIPVYAAGLMSRGAAMTFVCHDDRQNLQFFQYAPGDAAARGGNKLVSRADIHIGAQTVSLQSHFCRSSILVNSATPSSTLAALKSQDSLYGRSDDDQRLGVHFGTSDGGFTAVIPLNEPDYWRLAALQSVLANALESDCALNPRAWRLFRRTPRRGGCRNNDRRKGVIDGDLVIQFCDLPTADQEDLASAIGSTVELIIDNLLELRCSSMVI